ncbi:hypothetical protein PR048_031625 [Dryococelus australis]|uniref:Uncharacterized protein n=1 Tax=Dryococelus australis TaxID=614101 RepID=A0ABQ9G5T4_9NEOP|nr:hypothetical protein PR048_031625 [Dryococelus australis]
MKGRGGGGGELHDSHMRESGSDTVGNRTRFTDVGGYYTVIRRQQCSPIGLAHPELRPQPYRTSLGRIGSPGEGSSGVAKIDCSTHGMVARGMATNPRGCPANTRREQARQSGCCYSRKRWRYEILMDWQPPSKHCGQSMVHTSVEKARVDPGREDCFIVRQVESTPRESLRTIQGHVTAAGDTPVSTRRIAERDLLSRHPLPLLPEHRRARTTAEFESVNVLTIALFHTSIVERHIVRARDVMMWGFTPYYPHVPQVVIKRTLSARRWVHDILRACELPFLVQLDNPDALFTSKWLNMENSLTRHAHARAHTRTRTLHSAVMTEKHCLVANEWTDGQHANWLQFRSGCFALTNLRFSITCKIDTENCCAIRVQRWTRDRDEVHFEPPKLAVRNIDPRSATIIEDSEIRNHENFLVQHFYIGTKIKLDPASELGSFDLGSRKMVQLGISNFLATRSVSEEVYKDEHGARKRNESGRIRMADLPWRSRLACHRSGVREALGSNHGHSMGVNIS